MCNKPKPQIWYCGIIFCGLFYKWTAVLYSLISNEYVPIIKHETRKQNQTPIKSPDCQSKAADGGYLTHKLMDWAPHSITCSFPVKLILFQWSQWVIVIHFDYLNKMKKATWCTYMCLVNTYIPLYLPGKNYPFSEILTIEKPTYSQNAYHFTEDLKNSTSFSYLKAPNSKLYLSQEDLSLFHSCFLPVKMAQSTVSSNPTYTTLIKPFLRSTLKWLPFMWLPNIFF